MSGGVGMALKRAPRSFPAHVEVEMTTRGGAIRLYLVIWSAYDGVLIHSTHLQNFEGGRDAYWI